MNGSGGDFVFFAALGFGLGLLGGEVVLRLGLGGEGGAQGGGDVVEADEEVVELLHIALVGGAGVEGVFHFVEAGGEDGGTVFVVGLHALGGIGHGGGDFLVSDRPPHTPSPLHVQGQPDPALSKAIS